MPVDGWGPQCTTIRSTLKNTPKLSVITLWQSEATIKKTRVNNLSSCLQHNSQLSEMHRSFRRFMKAFKQGKAYSYLMKYWRITSFLFLINNSVYDLGLHPHRIHQECFCLIVVNSIHQPRIYSCLSFVCLYFFCQCINANKYITLLFEIIRHDWNSL